MIFFSYESHEKQYLQQYNPFHDINPSDNNRLSSQLMSSKKKEDNLHLNYLASEICVSVALFYSSNFPFLVFYQVNDEQPYIVSSVCLTFPSRNM